MIGLIVYNNNIIVNNYRKKCFKNTKQKQAQVLIAYCTTVLNDPFKLLTKRPYYWKENGCFYTTDYICTSAPNILLSTLILLDCGRKDPLIKTMKLFNNVMQNCALRFILRLSLNTRIK